MKTYADTEEEKLNEIGDSSSSKIKIIFKKMRKLQTVDKNDKNSQSIFGFDWFLFSFF